MNRRDFLGASLSAFAALLGVPGIPISKVAIPAKVEPTGAAFSEAVGQVVEDMWLAASRRVEVDIFYKGDK